MTHPEPNITVKVDVTNPGQFFACCGLLELADRLWPGAEGWFEDRLFHISVDLKPDVNHLEKMLETVIECDVEVIPDERANDKEAPIRIGEPLDMSLDWWLNHDRSANRRFKTWAANASSLQMFCKWQKPLGNLCKEILKNPECLLEEPLNVQGSYGFDSRMGWDALDVGFSLNEHAHLKKLPLRPAIELFGAIGLQRFFPSRNQDNDGIVYQAWYHPLGAVVAACGVKRCLDGRGFRGFNSRFVMRGSFKGFDYANPFGDQS